MKRLEKFYPMMMFSRTSTETVPSKKPNHPETTPLNLVCRWKIFSNREVLYNTRKVIKCRL